MKLRMVFVALIAVLLPCLGWSQSASPTAQSSATGQPVATTIPTVLPKNPKDLMLLAAQVNGLQGIDHPWHVKANYQTFDADGKPKDQGVFEEWWASPEKYKISYVSKRFNQVEYRDGSKDMVTGDKSWPPQKERMVRWLLVNPMPSPSEISAQKYKSKDSMVSGVKLNCVWADAPSEYSPVPMFCMGSQLPAIRIKTEWPLLIFFNKVVRAGTQYLPEQIRVGNRTRPFLNADVSALDFLPEVQDAVFLAPAGAVPVAAPPPIIPAAVAAGNRVSGENPIYPAIAKAAHVQGTVVIAVTISKAGDVKDARVIHGPLMLREAALVAVRTWKYKPYLLSGQPVEVETSINVIYRLVP